MEAVEALLSLADADRDEAQATAGVASQTDLTSTNLHDTQKQLDEQLSVINDLTLWLTQLVTPFDEESLKSDEIVKFYTGFPNMKVLNAVFSLVEKAVQNCDTCKLSPFQEFMATVVKLWLNCQVQDLAYRFNISCATVSLKVDESNGSVFMSPDFMARL